MNELKEAFEVVQLHSGHVANDATANPYEPRIFSLTTFDLKCIPKNQLIISHMLPVGQREGPRVSRTQQEFDAVKCPFGYGVTCQIA